MHFIMDLLRIVWFKIKRIYIKICLIKNKKCIFKSNCSVDFLSCTFEGANRIASHAVLSHVQLGFATYVGEETKLVGGVKIGRYCSIGPNVHIISGKHPSNTFVSTHPCFFSTAKQAGFTFVQKDKYKEHSFADEQNGLSVIIGNDVWIGDGVQIMEGVSIADGTIVGAGAVVTKNTEPFSIVVGIPATIIKYRFDRECVNVLNEFKWWNKDYLWLEKNASLFEDISMLINVIKGEQSK